MRACPRRTRVRQTAYNGRMTSLKPAVLNSSSTLAGAALARPSTASTLGRLDVARALLLEPFGLTDAALARALGEITSYGVDDADLYFQ